LKKEIDRLKKENEVMDSKIKTMTILGGKWYVKKIKRIICKTWRNTKSS
jgi:hypothetical protein